MSVTRTIADLCQDLGELLKQRFTGEIVLGQPKAVTIYLSSGKLLWVTDRVHPVRRWHRAIQKHCNDKSNTDLTALKKISNYQQLSQAILGQNIAIESAKAAIAEVARECFFEILGEQSVLGKLTWEIDSSKLKLPTGLTLSTEETETVLTDANSARQQWQAANLENYLPSSSPVLQQEQIYDAMDIPIPKNYLQGDRTLWDVALAMQTSIVLITRSLVHLERQNIINFKQIPDIAATQNGNSSSESSQTKQRNYGFSPTTPQPETNKIESDRVKSTVSSSFNFDRSKPLIACIDDSPVLGHSVKKILTSVGYQSLIIPEPMAGMGLLVKYRPSLILLDLLMPTVNGYSVCKFLRETNLFKTTPIVILTAKDTLVDRTRAKLAGATDFITKPPEPQELLHVVRMHITDVPWS
jgi:two-component system, chemotaxis family, response regulator PixG